MNQPTKTLYNKQKVYKRKEGLKVKEGLRVKEGILETHKLNRF